MSRSWRTEPSEKQAHFRVARASDGTPLPPRIDVHPPRPGDVHLLDKQLLLALLSRLPLDYRHGLRRIELRPRESKTVGSPFATYHVRERSIRLYSTPARDWPFPPSHPGSFSIYKRFGADITFDEGLTVVHWKTSHEAKRFIFACVFAHELGHHFDHKYKHRWKLPVTVQGEELAADTHIRRLKAWRVFNTVLRDRMQPDDG
jgi:hypothetical protein